MPTGATAPGGSRWHSLRWRLPLTISVVVTAILAVILLAAYREVESAIVGSGRQRAQAAAGQVASLLEASLRGSAQVRNAATIPAVREYLKTRRPEQLAEVNAILEKLLAGAAPRTVTLWDDRGARLAEASKPTPPESSGPAELPPSIAPTADGLQPLRAAGNGAFLESVAIVSDLFPGHARLGYVDIRSGFAITPPGLFSKLVGDNASVLLGNRDGSLAALASILLMRALTTRLTRPLAEMTAATEAVAGGDYSRHLGSSRADELGRLARAFEQVAGRPVTAGHRGFRRPRWTNRWCCCAG